VRSANTPAGKTNFRKRKKRMRRIVVPVGTIGEHR